MVVPWVGLRTANLQLPGYQYPGSHLYIMKEACEEEPLADPVPPCLEPGFWV